MVAKQCNSSPAAARRGKALLVWEFAYLHTVIHRMLCNVFRLFMYPGKGEFSRCLTQQRDGEQGKKDDRKPLLSDLMITISVRGIWWHRKMFAKDIFAPQVYSISWWSEDVTMYYLSTQLHNSTSLSQHNGAEGPSGCLEWIRFLYSLHDRKTHRCSDARQGWWQEESYSALDHLISFCSSIQSMASDLTIDY